MIWRTSTLTWALFTCQHLMTSAQVIWPASIDELEDIMMLNAGHRARGFANAVTPCTKETGPGRLAAAEWIRTAFHDMATGNTFTGVGGLDASIAFEITSSENVGPAFATTLNVYVPFFSSRLSLSDVIAAGVYTATRSCGGPSIPVRGGRIDATRAGAQGVPLPQNAAGTFRNQFLRMGYSSTEMIQFVACGHTLGSTHSENFPDIVPTGKSDLDTTPAAFDNAGPLEYVAGITKNRLAFPPPNKKNADWVVYSSDGNATIRAMTNAGTFQSVCRTMFQKMIDVVPSGVVLSDVVTPYEIKPYDLQLTLADGGSSVQFTGEIRVRTTQRSKGSITGVQLVYKDRIGASSSTPIMSTPSGEATGFDDTFSFFTFSANIPVQSSISSFNVLVKTVNGDQTYDNNGAGFKVDDSVIYQAPQSCLDGSGKLTVAAAVRKGAAVPNLQVVVQIPRASPNPLPSLSTATVPMATQTGTGLYDVYSASYSFSGSQAQSAEFGVFADNVSDKNKRTSGLPTTCIPLDTSPPTSTPSSPAFSFQGCYSDAGAPRALSASGSADDAMTVERCAAFCSTYQLFGMEYGRECYCGNTLDASSNVMGLSDCSMPCSGNPSQTCGAGSRLSLYKNSKFVAPVNPPITGYNYLGCYSEADGGRTLGDTDTTSDDMTVEKCATFCNGSGYFGLEYSKECYCGAILNAGSTLQPAGDCSMRCAGNSTEWCGAGRRLNVYQKIGVPTPISTTISVPPPNPTAPSLPGYNYTGCFVDTVSQRSLSGRNRQDDNNSYESCASFCDGYQYFGVEYGHECYCADKLSSPMPELRKDDECSMPCAGNSTEHCGAASRITVFKSLTMYTPPANPLVFGYNYTGCFTDSVGARVLQLSHYFDSNMTIAKCATFCSGSKYFGTQYGGECYCGDNFVNPTTNVQEKDCSFVCPGNKEEYCGAGDRLSLWQKIEGVGNGTTTE
ncbi:heme peroxidase [Dendryphion nanum]|uniref:Heme peroxidase n=1 Tax=Dendryphion nanum TaxID=256645 RepID=A0A9P9E3W6_9PLEO|nr:heme peroxidase [Dendryphion nanum]